MANVRALEHGMSANKQLQRLPSQQSRDSETQTQDMLCLICTEAQEIHVGRNGF
jgi:hypothetical protein